MRYEPYRYSDYIRTLYNQGVSIKLICFRLKIKEETVREWCGMASNGSDLQDSL